MMVYKVVNYNKKTNKYFSAVIRTSAKQEYKIGVKHITPDWLAKLGLYFCAFKTLSSARAFANSGFGPNYCFKIFKAFTSKIYDAPFYLDPDDLTKEILSNNSLYYWRQQVPNLFPKDTVMCKDLTFLEEVK